MCGINGIFSKTPLQDTTLIKRMNARVVHRGPDDEGFYTSSYIHLGMRRLSIVDLSLGHQPIMNEDNRFTIIFNGEIYNFRQLREDLIRRGHVFKTFTDTEVVIHLYEEKREKCLDDINGMFAFAVYDSRSNELFLARDRVGKKPLYYCMEQGCFIFASELKSILEIVPRKRRISHEAVEQLFAFTFIPAPLTIFEDIYKLEAGSFLKVSGDLSLTKRPYWNLVETIKNTRKNSDYGYCSQQLKTLLYDAVEKRMISDVPLGAFLSGGIDSTIIVALMSELSRTPIKTFTIRNSVKTYDESSKARMVGHKYKTDYTEWTVDNDYIIDKIDAILDNFDEPFADSSALPSYVVSELASRHVKVVLTGDGGDELFAGYTRYLTFHYLRTLHAVPDCIRKMVIKPLVNNLRFPNFLELKVNRLRKLVNNEGMNAFEQHHHLQRLGYSENDIAHMLPGLHSAGRAKDHSQSIFNDLQDKTDLEKALATDIIIGLEGDMLVKVDRTSMLHSVEARSPFLDYRLIEHSFTIPDSFKLHGSTLKWILRRTFADKFPKNIVRKRKMGFGIPVGRLLKRELRSSLEELLKFEGLQALGLFNMHSISTLMSQHYSNLDRTFQLWTFFVFAKWVRKNLPFIEL